MEPLNLEGKDLESEVDSLALTQHLRKEVIKKLIESATFRCELKSKVKGLIDFGGPCRVTSRILELTEN